MADLTSTPIIEQSDRAMRLLHRRMFRGDGVRCRGREMFADFIVGVPCSLHGSTPRPERTGCAIAFRLESASDELSPSSECNLRGMGTFVKSTQQLIGSRARDSP